MTAYSGRVARVNLTSGKWDVKESANLAHRFLGGRGVNIWIWINELTYGGNPLSPASTLGSYALEGSMAPAACYTSIGSKNSSTGRINCAYAVGHIAPAIKQASFDNPIVSGCSGCPIKLNLHNYEVERKDSTQLRGMTAQVMIRGGLSDDEFYETRGCVK